MANHKSAAKRARQSVRKAAFNSRTKSTVRTFEKKLRKLITDGKKQEAQQLLVVFSSRIDKAAKKGVVPSGTASRKVSRLSKQVFALNS